ncbi:MAG: RNA methyltransferase [Bacteroidetes bacterium]|nr:RNA methyltransferase [Bacteroidota bacterium]
MLSNAQVKFITSLQVKKYRELHSRFIAEGSKLVLDFLGSAYHVDTIYAIPEWMRENQTLLATLQPNLQEVTPSELSRITGLATSSPVLAIVKIPDISDNTVNVNKGLTLVLDDIRDPGNLGTIIRIADWFGIRRIICSETTVDLYNPKVVQGTMGSIARVSVKYLPLVSFLSSIPADLPVYGTFLKGENIYKCNLQPDAIVIIGNESYGISDDVALFVTQRIFIPGNHTLDPSSSSAESLNAAVATAIVCSEFRRNLLSPPTGRLTNM